MSKDNNYSKLDGGESQKYMVLDNWEEEELVNITAMEIANYIKEKADDETIVKTNLITSDGKHIVKSDRFTVRFDRENNEVILANYV